MIITGGKEPAVRIGRSVGLVRQKVTDVTVFLGAAGTDHLWVVVQLIPSTADKPLASSLLGGRRFRRWMCSGDRDAC
ncbi:MAG: hypothetical protein VX643_06710 [Chloroflexota bacterium]|nr:hypothetical protein [Chloroflexota bacterium]